MIEILPYSPGHQAGVVSVIVPIQQQEFSIPVTLGEQPDLLDIPGFYQRGGGNFWVALHGGEVVGTIALLDIGNGQGALRKMFVKEAFRGSAHGVASRLLGALLRWCADRGLRNVFLGTTSRFLAAHRFYEKNGFREIDPGQLPGEFPVMAVDTRFYRLDLQGGGTPNSALQPTCEDVRA